MHSNQISNIKSFFPSAVSDPKIILDPSEEKTLTVVIAPFLTDDGYFVGVYHTEKYGFLLGGSDPRNKTFFLPYKNIFNGHTGLPIEKTFLNERRYEGQTNRFCAIFDPHTHTAKIMPREMKASAGPQIWMQPNSASNPFLEKNWTFIRNFFSNNAAIIPGTKMTVQEVGGFGFDIDEQNLEYDDKKLVSRDGRVAISYQPHPLIPDIYGIKILFCAKHQNNEEEQKNSGNPKNTKERKKMAEIWIFTQDIVLSPTRNVTILNELPLFIIEDAAKFQVKRQRTDDDLKKEREDLAYCRQIEDKYRQQIHKHIMPANLIIGTDNRDQRSSDFNYDTIVIGDGNVFVNKTRDQVWNMIGDPGFIVPGTDNTAEDVGFFTPISEKRPDEWISGDCTVIINYDRHAHQIPDSSRATHYAREHVHVDVILRTQDSARFVADDHVVYEPNEHWDYASRKMKYKFPIDQSAENVEEWQKWKSSFGYQIIESMEHVCHVLSPGIDREEAREDEESRTVEYDERLRQLVKNKDIILLEYNSKCTEKIHLDQVLFS